MNTWGERSTYLTESLIERINNYTNANAIAYEAAHGMSGFNDRIIIKPTYKDQPEYFMVSVIIGWFNADAELAIVHRFNDNSDFKLVTDHYLNFDNSLIEMPENRVSDDLSSNKIKYYESPFDEREEDIFQDILFSIEKLPVIEMKAN
jgi:hypothetical protein